MEPTIKKGKLEEDLIVNCAPTLAGMKTAGLFRHFYYSRREARKQLCQVNKLLNVRGVFAEALLWKEDAVLIYVYRPRYLEKELGQPEALELLEGCGYSSDNSMEGCIGQLKHRLYHGEDFPHEIGVFLGYPIEDVRGFIENKGKNCRSCGMWKVYDHEREKEKLFKKFTHCTQVYRQVFEAGRKLSQMTVCEKAS